MRNRHVDEMKFLFGATIRPAEEVGPDQFSFSCDRGIARAKAAARSRGIGFDSLHERVKAIAEALDEKLLSLTNYSNQTRQYF